VPWIRAVRVQSPECLESALAYDTPWLLLDAFSAGAYGGTGSRVDWAVASTFINNQPSRRVTLAGGLTVENVTAAVKSVRPFAVDVASGVESSGNPRKKDPRRMQDFIQSAKRAASK
jgi:phosphoribosylanthranilate isomerase